MELFTKYENKKSWLWQLQIFTENLITGRTEFRIAREMLAARARVGLSQEAVAEIMGTTKSAISRLESAGKHSPSMTTLKKYAHAVGCQLEIKLVPDSYLISHSTERHEYRMPRIYLLHENGTGKHPAVLECAVIAVPDEKWDGIPKAIVDLKPMAHATEKELVNFCRERMAAFKFPKTITFLSELPKTGSGKIL